MNRIVAWILLLLSASAAANAGSDKPAAPIKPFIDVTDAMGLKGNNGGLAAWSDLDNDGWVDLCIGGEVWRNVKGKRFTKVGGVAGPAIWGDFDNDGYLDLLHSSIRSGMFHSFTAPSQPAEARRCPSLTWPVWPVRIGMSAPAILRRKWS